MDKTQYGKKVREMLDDEEAYSKLKSNPTAKYKRNRNATLARLKREGKIAEQLYYFSTPQKKPSLDCTTHRKSTKRQPLRPIVDNTGSIAYNVSRSLADLLGPMVGLTQHHVKNSRHLADELQSMTLHED